MIKTEIAYIFPNLITASSAFLGILSIIASISHNFEIAVWYIAFAMILDGLDGRVARLTNTTSKFGVEFDSLADLIAFGVAPAILFYNYIGLEFGRLGALVTAMFAIFGAIRLARFNITSINDPTVFIGLPIPMAAVFTSMWILIFNIYSLDEYKIYLLVSICITSILMVSNIRYPSFKKMDFQKSNIFKILITIISILALVYIFPIVSITFIATLYLLLGLSRALILFLKNIKKHKA